MKSLRREKARGCAVHQAVLDQAHEMLKAHGYFSKEEVIEATGFGAIEDAVRWDYIREFIEQDYAVNLLPVAHRFFETHVKSKSGVRVRTADDRRLNPGRYLAGGNGKKTAGYVNVTLDNGELAIKKLENTQSLGNGVAKAFQQYLRAYKERGVALTEPLSKRLESDSQLC